MSIISTVEYPILFSKSSHDKNISWVIKVNEYSNESHIIIETGQVDCVLTKHTTIIKEGKNIGKKNETSHFTQAQSEAQSKWNKKNSTIKVSKEVKPMLAHKYKENKKKIVFPAYVQPKLDGYRGIYNHAGNTLLTRTGKTHNNVNHILKDLKSLNLPKDIIFDGELYNHGSLFENLGSLRKTKAPENSENAIIKYCIYDIINDDVFSKRFELLKEIFKNYNGNNIEIVSTFSVSNVDEIDELHLKFLKEKYEGAMVRNDALYKRGFRSFDLLKYKDFDDSEFKIVGVDIEKDSLTNCELIMFVCESNNANRDTFKVSPKGTKLARHEMYLMHLKNPDYYIGKYFTVQYFGTSSSNIPRFPKSLRDVNDPSFFKDC